jgi:hypothetical protein
MGFSARGVAAMTEANRRHSLTGAIPYRRIPYRSGALTSPLGNSRSGKRQRLRAFTGARQRSRSWQGEGSIPESWIG